MEINIVGLLLGSGSSVVGCIMFNFCITAFVVNNGRRGRACLLLFICVLDDAWSLLVVTLSH